MRILSAPRARLCSMALVLSLGTTASVMAAQPLDAPAKPGRAHPFRGRIKTEAEFMDAAKKATAAKSATDRARSIRMLAGATTFPATRRLESIIAAIKSRTESSDAEPKKSILNSYLAEDELLQRWELLALEEMESLDRPTIRGHLSSAKGRFRDRMLMVAATAGDEQAILELVTVLEKSSDGMTRADAARALGRSKASAVAVALRNALNDPFMKTFEVDHGIPDKDGKMWQHVFPVKEAACASLRRMGHGCTRRGDVFSAPVK